VREDVRRRVLVELALRRLVVVGRERGDVDEARDAIVGPRRAEGREGIRATLGPVWERAKKNGRNILGHDHIVVHETRDPEVIFVEFDVYGEAASTPFRQSLLYLLRVRAGHIALLRDYVDTAALNALFRTASAGA
jgi:ketosteroid isomerase-like protein